MTAFYVMAIVLVVWALVLSAFGITQENFPRNAAIGRGIVALSALLIAGTIVALLATTEREHPREEAKAEAAERAGGGEEGQPPAGKPDEAAGKPAKQGAPGPVAVEEREYSIELASGSTVPAGKLTFDVGNEGKIQHDLAVEAPGNEAKTPLIEPGKSASLKVDLEPGRYKLYCSVPGHEQLGMKVEVTAK